MVIGSVLIFELDLATKMVGVSMMVLSESIARGLGVCPYIGAFLLVFQW